MAGKSSHVFPISIDDIVQDNPFEAEPPDEEDYQGFTGNEGANATHWYRRAAFLILPISGAVDFFPKIFPARASLPFSIASRYQWLN